MKKQHILPTIIICLIVISGVIGFSACASIVSAEPQGGIESHVNTAVAATLVQYMIETKVAAQSIALVSEPIAQVQATEPPVPTATPIPTEPAPPTAAPTAEVVQPAATAVPVSVSGLKIFADQNTNCRVGPSTGYRIVTYFKKGSESTVEGRDKNKGWWYIVNPSDSSDFCWVWDGSTTVQGDTSTLAVVAAPTGESLKASNMFQDYNVYDPYGWNGYDGYGYNNWNFYPNNYCGKTINWGKNINCKPKIKNCYPTNWKPCKNCNPINWNPVNWNPCKNTWQNTCKKSSCPALTPVNYQNYCNKYPNCCD